MTFVSTRPPAGQVRNRALPLVQLRAFEAVARHLNFRLAAEELLLTQSAVSRQVLALEEAVGVKLLDRSTRSVELTSAGTRLLHALIPSLERIDTAVQQIRAQAGRPSVVVTTWASFASIWLIPRLEAFQAQYPEIDIHVRTTDASIDLDANEADIALRYTRESGVPAGSECMFEEQIIAVASPLLLKGVKAAKAIRAPQDLHPFTLIEAGDAHTNQRLSWLTWHGWSKWHKLPDLQPRRWLYFDYSHQVAQATLSGHGVALSRLPLAADDLARGELVEVLPQYRIPSPMGYWIVTANRSRARPEIVAFTEWLMEQAQRTQQTMERVSKGHPKN